MNYIKELNAFRDWLLTNELSTGEIALWYTLMSINNMTGWKEWFTAPNSTVQLLTGLSKQGLDNARNKLVQKELILYKKGTKNTAGFYKINSLVNQPVNNSDQKVDQTIDQSDDQCLTNRMTNSGPDTRTFFKQNTNETETLSSGVIGADESVNPFKLFEQEGFGTISSIIHDRIGDLIDTYTERWVIEAMKEAVFQGKRSISYVEGILKRWKAEGIDNPWEKRKSDKVVNFPRNQGRGKQSIPVADRKSEPVSKEELAEILAEAKQLEGYP